MYYKVNTLKTGAARQEIMRRKAFAESKRRKKMNSIHLTEGEMEIMEVLWECGRPMGFGELHKRVNDRTKRNWKKQTMNTLLFRIRQKNLAGDVSEGGRRLYVPLITRNEYIREISQEFLDRNCEGSFSKMLTALGGGEKVSEEEKSELKRIMEEWEKE